MMTDIVTWLQSHLDLWKIIGLFGQVMFGGRFVIQWLASERVKQSIVPETFWYFSLAGGAILFAYAIHVRDIVFIVGQGLGLFIYARNLILIHGKKPKLNG